MGAVLATLAAAVVAVALALPESVRYYYTLLLSFLRMLRLLINIKREQKTIMAKEGGWVYADEVIAAARDCGEQTFLEDVGSKRKLTFDEHDVLSDRVAFWLRRKGVLPGDTVALFLPNSVEYVAIWVGAAKAGATAALLHASLQG
eukprot:CAMPEP_0118882436 /NCGR_PEP_ID=MMETSP1163-20130328/21691_1 /TAXON_ID=124430 /ORGANISM="Phaeomonas parva, Strain CCMP2877" /LENGTH=145 /DNA_ID=CAMNT_0006819497 /DNA_START=200 /DNA_END=634 /DNA_ORIENTATION=+